MAGTGEISKFCVSVHLETLFRNNGNPPFFMASIAMTGSPKIPGHLSCWKLWFVKMPICSNLQLPICYVSQYVYYIYIIIIYIYIIIIYICSILFVFVEEHHVLLLKTFCGVSNCTKNSHVMPCSAGARSMTDRNMGCKVGAGLPFWSSVVQCGQRTLSNMLCCFGAITFKNVANMGPWEVFKTTLCIAMALAVVMSLRL